MSGQKTNRILELDALRGIAAIFVVLFHLSMNKPQVESLFNKGITGVELFFIISGFVILMTIEKVKRPKEFIIGRITRLYPAYWACVSFTAALIVFFIYKTITLPFTLQYLANMTMFQNYFLQAHLDDPYWTLFVEMLFYIFMLLILVSGGLKNIITISVIALIPCAAFGLYFSYQSPSIDTNTYRFFPLINFFPLFLSGIIYYKLKFGQKRTYLFALLILCFIIQLSLFHTVAARSLFINIYEYAAMVALYNAVFLLYVYNKLSFIVNPVTLFLGNMSYPLYLIHQHISLNVLMPKLLIYCNFWMAAGIDLGIVLLLSFIVNKYIEKPTMRYARNKWLKRSAIKESEMAASVTI